MINRILIVRTMLCRFQIAGCALLLSGWAVAANTNFNNESQPQPLVTVTVNQQQLQFTYLPRLSDVLAPLAMQQNWYWPAAALYKYSEQPERLRNKFLADLNLLLQDASPQLQLTLRSLRQQVVSWQLAERISQPIDYDIARIRSSANPTFDAGSYQLHLVTRPTTVMVIGAVVKPGKLSHQAASPIVDYIKQLSLLPAADTNNVVVITASGEVQPLAVGYWHKQHIELMPGATMLILLTPGLFNNQIVQLNSQLTELARHRVLP